MGIRCPMSVLYGSPPYKAKGNCMANANLDLFSTIPRKSYLNLYDGEKANYQSLKSFLDLQKADIAKAASVPVGSIREDRLPKEVEERLFEIATICELVAEFFEGDATKTAQWFKMPNPAFGSVSPRDLIRLGRFRKVMTFVQNAVSSNRAGMAAAVLAQ